MIDIIKIKQAIKAGELKAYIKDSRIYLENDIGEVVEIGNKNHHDIDPICKYCEYFGDIHTCFKCEDYDMHKKARNHDFI